MSAVVIASLLPDPPARRHEELDLQRDVVKFLRWALPDEAMCFHIPNGGPRHGKARAILAGQGLRAGIPDLCVLYRGKAFFLELKAKRGALSAVQRQMFAKLHHCGIPVMLVRSVPEAEAALREACVPLRATVL